MICLDGNQHEVTSLYTSARSRQDASHWEQIIHFMSKGSCTIEAQEQLMFRLYNEHTTQLMQQVGLPVSQQQWVGQARGSLA